MARSLPYINRNFVELDDINGVFKSAYDGDLNACIDYINNNEKAINDLISETKKYSLLELAVRNNNYCLSKKLIELGADVNYKNADGRSILYVAITWNKKTKTMGYAKGSKEGSKENTDIELIKLLINNGANVNELVGYRYEDGTVSLFTISLLRIYDCVDPLCDMDIPRILLENGANPNVGRSSVFGLTLLLLFKICLKYQGDNRLSFDPFYLFSFVVKSGATDEMDEDGDRCLDLIIENTERKIDVKKEVLLCNALFNNGVSVDSLNKDNETPLFCAMKYYKYDLAIFFLMRGANVRFVCNGRTPYDLNPSLFKEHFYHRRRNILLMRRHDDYETNKEHHPTKLAELIMDDSDLMRRIASFL